MGRASKRKPVRLSEKLLQIRIALGLSQNELIKRLGFSDEIMQGSISGYELGTRSPPLDILLAYAQAAGVCVDVLINDRLELPEELPDTPDHQVMKRAVSERGKPRR
jgi:transcriptional regulator with XRE-family HTH domain